MASAAADGANAAPRYTGNVIVRWRDAQQPTAAPLQQLAEKTGVGLTVKRSMSGNAQLLGVSGGAVDPEALAAQLRQDPRVADAVPDRWLRPYDTVPNDPAFPSQPYLASPSTVPGGANLPAAWDLSRGSASVVIAVLDTGVLGHSDLAARLINGYDFISDPQFSLDGNGRDADPTDAGDNMPSGYTCPGGAPPAPTNQPNSWHGTRVASVLGATTDNGSGIAGVDWQARIQPVRVSGRCGAQLSDTIDGMRWAGGLPVPGAPANPTPARVINISLGGGACSSFEQQAIDELTARGVVVVAAAGNSGGPVEAPANCRGVLGITAHVNDGENASYASVGPEVALSAPGGGCGNSKISNGVCQTPVSAILTLSNTGTTSQGSDTVVQSAGTSFAAPMVSGVAGLMLAVNGALSPAQVGDLLKSTSRPHPPNTYCTTPGNIGKCGAGLLDAGRAVAAASGTRVDPEPTPTPAPTPTPSPTPTPTPTPAPADDGGGGAVPLEAALLLALGGALLLGWSSGITPARGSSRRR